MTVEIMVYDYDDYDILKKLAGELKKKHPINTEVNAFGIEMKLNVNSFDEVIALLAKYNEQTKIELSIHNANEVRVYVEHKDANKLVDWILDN
jgi:short-subunit dehydrogenase involved in D-alanine esterification of teichoic acids